MSCPASGKTPGQGAAKGFDAAGDAIGEDSMDSQLPLRGLRVLDIGALLAGPLVSTILGDFGAEVWKIEKPDGGDALRQWGYQKDGVPLFWQLVARNKKSATLDLRQPEGQKLFLEMVREADVVVESFRPGTLDRWSVGWETLHAANERLVLVHVSGFGQTGPYRQRPGFGTLAEAMSGFAAITGYPGGPPTLPPFGLADSIAATTACWATMFALWERDVQGSGKGQEIDVSLYEPMLTVLGPQILDFDQLGVVQSRYGNRSPHVAPRNVYATADDKWVALSAATQSIAARVLALIGRPELIDDPRFATNAARVEHVDELDALIEEWMGDRTRDEVLEAFATTQAALAPVYSAEDLLDDPHVKARESIRTLEHPDLGPLRMQNVMARLSRTPGAVREPAPHLGEHNEELYGSLLGVPAVRYAQLERDGVV